MLVSFATGLVAQQALPGIQREAEFAQTRQRETRDLPHHHRRRPILRHLDRHLRQRAVRLADGQSDFVATTITPRNNDRFPTTGMKAVTNSRLTKLIAGIMLLLRQHRVRSSAAAPPRSAGPPPRAGGRAPRSARRWPARPPAAPQPPPAVARPRPAPAPARRRAAPHPCRRSGRRA